ncbi:MAG TPA: hypothetical protein VJ875_02915 [Pyrinomonadaceae bacterium]|nr:hypothetical protein [Pyrinomonadaceae bacterium]
MRTSKPLNDTAQWQRSDLQYPRLIAEILATGALDTNHRTAICASMDLESHRLDELLHRAESDWTTIKQIVVTRRKSPSTLRCPHCNYNGKKPTDNGHGFRYLSDQTTWREVVKVEKGILIIRGWAEIYDEDAETNERLECRSCLAEFPIAPDLETDFC